jgi:hypothetical protein
LKRLSTVEMRASNFNAVPEAFGDLGALTSLRYEGGEQEQDWWPSSLSR